MKTNAIPYAISLSISDQSSGLIGEHLTLSMEGPGIDSFYILLVGSNISNPFPFFTNSYDLL